MSTYKLLMQFSYNDFFFPKLIHNNNIYVRGNVSCDQTTNYKLLKKSYGYFSRQFNHLDIMKVKDPQQLWNVLNFFFFFFFSTQGVSRLRISRTRLIPLRPERRRPVPSNRYNHWDSIPGGREWTTGPKKAPVTNRTTQEEP